MLGLPEFLRILVSQSLNSFCCCQWVLLEWYISSLIFYLRHITMLLCFSIFYVFQLILILSWLSCFIVLVFVLRAIQNVFKNTFLLPTIHTVFSIILANLINLLARFSSNHLIIISSPVFFSLELPFNFLGLLVVLSLCLILLWS